MVRRMLTSQKSGKDSLRRRQSHSWRRTVEVREHGQIRPTGSGSWLVLVVRTLQRHQHYQLSAVLQKKRKLILGISLLMFAIRGELRVKSVRGAIVQSLNGKSI